jgi:hypothetical protein
VEHLGSHYIVVLHDRELREGLIASAEQSERSIAQTRTSVRLRLRLATALRALAIRIDPQVPRLSEAGSQQPAFAE